MKNKPLMHQILIVFSILLISIIILTGIINIYLSKIAAEESIFREIEYSQDLILPSVEEDFLDHFSKNLFSVKVSQGIRNTRHMFFTNKKEDSVGLLLETNYKYLPDDIVDNIYIQAKEQIKDRGRYIIKRDSNKLFYVIHKNDNAILYGLVSYQWNDYWRAIENTMLKQLIVSIIVITIIAFLASFFLSKRLTKPLEALQEAVRSIAQGNKDTPLVIDRKDEIGNLGISIDNLRKQLIEREIFQEASLQYISHELKTPIMVIRSYAQSIEDGIFPNGTLNNSVIIIGEQALRVENTVKELLFFTKMHYRTLNKIEYIKFDLSKLLNQVINILKHTSTQLEWIVENNEVFILGDIEQWNIIFENILSNQIRYSKNYIKIILKKVKDKTELVISNDGKPIDSNIIDSLFTPYVKGNDGKTGLGLAIVKNIVNNHNGEIEAKNVPEGVVFKIILNKTN